MAINALDIAREWVKDVINGQCISSRTVGSTIPSEILRVDFWKAYGDSLRVEIAYDEPYLVVELLSTNPEWKSLASESFKLHDPETEGRLKEFIVKHMKHGKKRGSYE